MTDRATALRSVCWREQSAGSLGPVALATQPSRSLRAGTARPRPRSRGRCPRASPTAPLDDFADGSLRCVDGLVNCGPNVMFLALHDDARRAADDHLGRANLVDTAAWPVRVADAHRDALDRRRELSEPEPHLAPNIRALLAREPHAAGPDARGCPARVQFPGTGDLSWERAPSHVSTPFAYRA